MVANNQKTTKVGRGGNTGNGFKKGKSGNPSGRPKKTQEQIDALEQIKQLAPKAVEQLSNLIESDDTPPAAKMKAIEIVLDRTYGKPDMSVKVETPKADHLDDIKNELEKLKGDAM